MRQDVLRGAGGEIGPCIELREDRWRKRRQVGDPDDPRGLALGRVGRRRLTGSVTPLMSSQGASTPKAARGAGTMRPLSSSQEKMKLPTVKKTAPTCPRPAEACSPV